MFQSVRAPPTHKSGAPLTQKSNPGTQYMKKNQAAERIFTNVPWALPGFTGQSGYPTVPPVHPRLIVTSNPLHASPSSRSLTFLLITCNVLCGGRVQV